MARRGAAFARIVERGYWSEREGRVVVEAWERSGQTMAAFARRHDVAAKRLARWVRRLQEAEQSSGPTGFHPVRVVRRAGAGEKRTRGIEVVRNGWRVRVAPGVAAEDLRRVLEIVAGAL
jgi:transposase-like protein